MSNNSSAREFLDHARLRIDIEKAILTHAGVSKSSKTDTASLLRLVDATSIASELCDKLQRDAVHQARRAEIPWSEIGAGMGITRQAVQQRFAHEEIPQAHTNSSRTIPGATAFNEMQILEYEGKAGYHLVGFGPLFLTVLASTHVWEHRRLLSFNMTSEREHLETEGWTYVGSWFPFHYFKRIIS